MKYRQERSHKQIHLGAIVALLVLFTVVLMIVLPISGTTVIARQRPIDVFFSNADSSGDGLISAQEWRDAMAKRMQTIDSNHDGYISKVELEQSRETMRQRMGGIFQ